MLNIVVRRPIGQSERPAQGSWFGWRPDLWVPSGSGVVSGALALSADGSVADIGGTAVVVAVVGVVPDAGAVRGGDALLGLTAMLAVAAHQGWTPVLEPLLPPVAIVIGASAGIVAGVYPALVASHLQPTEALRHE